MIAKKLWSQRVVGSKVVRIDPDVFRSLQSFAVERGMERSTPAQVLRKVFVENNLLENPDGERDDDCTPGDVEGGQQN